MNNNKLICILFALLFLSSPTLAQVPRMLSHQGYLTSVTGQPLDTTLSMGFQLFPDSTGGGSLWNQSFTGVSVSKGIFKVALGPVTLPFNSQYWLEVQAGSETITPRTRLTSAAYALRADTAEYVKNLPAGLVGGFTHMQVFTSSGTWIRPIGVTSIMVEVVGGGGGGGGSSGAPSYVSGGGGGGYSKKLIASGLGDNEIVIVGAGGAGGSPGTSGSLGGTSSFGSWASATGGNGGSPGNAAGVGGVGSSGDINCGGQSGQGGTGPISGSGGSGGIGGSSILGGGGTVGINTAGGVGQSYGGGGGGVTDESVGANYNGGNGGSGVVIVYW